MRVAALYDIHGNLPALEAVLAEIRGAGVDQIIVGGDVVPGPLPQETLQLLLECEIPTRFIRGNGEVAVLASMSGKDPGVPAQFREVIDWNAQQLGEYQDLLGSWPLTLSLELDRIGRVLFCHATPRNENEIFTRLTPEDGAAVAFAGLDCALVICGHTHMHFDRSIAGVRVVNAGSVGMPYGAPGAYWLLLTPEVELRQTQYDFSRAAERIRQTSYPQAEDFAAQSVLRPRSEQEILQLFTRAELK